MFIGKLYRHSKPMFLLFVGFLFAFVFINYKWGMVATPVLQFGMYSGKHLLTDSIVVYSVIANNKKIEPSQISAGENDFIQTYLELYPTHRENNSLISAILNKYLGLMPGPRQLPEHPVTDKVFTEWFSKKMQALVPEPIQSLQATRQQFIWINKKLAPAGIVSKLDFLDAH